MSDQTLLAIIIALAGLIGVVYLAKAIFNVSEMIKHQKIQIRLLIEIARAQGVSEDTITQIKLGSLSKTLGNQNKS